jgi:hypothetical protein
MAFIYTIQPLIEAISDFELNKGRNPQSQVFHLMQKLGVFRLVKIKCRNFELPVQLATEIVV